MPDPITAIVGGTATLGSSAVGAIGANSAADTQAEATRDASNTELQAQREAAKNEREMYEEGRSDLAPWRSMGASVIPTLLDNVSSPAYSTGFNLLGLSGQAARDEARKSTGYIDLTGQYEPFEKFATNLLSKPFQASPGYQFALDQGTKAIERSAAAKGNLLSPATMMDLSKYTTGLANQDYYNWLGNMLSTQGSLINTETSKLNIQNSLLNQLLGVDTNKWNKLSALSSQGENAAARSASQAMELGTTLGNQAIQTGQLVGNNQIAAGNAQAGGMINTSNAITGGLNSLSTNLLLSRLISPTGTGNLLSGGSGGSAIPISPTSMGVGSFDTAGYTNLLSSIG